MGAIPQAAQDHQAYGETLFRRGLLVAAREEFAAWHNLVAPTEDSSQILPPVNALVQIAGERKELDMALAWLNTAAPLLENEPVGSGQGSRTRSMRVRVLTELGRYEEAAREAEVALEWAQRSGVAVLLGNAYLNAGRLRGRMQEWLMARRLADLALEHYGVTGDRNRMARAVLNRGLAHMEMGAFRLAERDLTKALQQFAELDASVEQALTYTELGRLAYRLGDRDRALEMGSKTLDLLLSDVTTLDKDEVARVSELFGNVMADAGHRTQALKYLNRAAAYFSQLGMLGEWQRVTERIASVLTDRTRASSSARSRVADRLEFLTAVLDLTDDIESVDPYLRGHSERVASLACITGKQAGLNAAQLRIVAYAGRLHDVGKVAVDAGILTKQGPLTTKEWERVQVHPIVGEEMVRPYGLDRDGLAAIRHHHERWGGGGYPDGVLGRSIPILARILSVADVYDAVTSDRAYRRAMSHQQAMDLLRQMAGRELDPDLVAAFSRLHEL